MPSLLLWFTRGLTRTELVANVRAQPRKRLLIPAPERALPDRRPAGLFLSSNYQERALAHRYVAKPIGVRLRPQDRELILAATVLPGEHLSELSTRAPLSRARKVPAHEDAQSVLFREARSKAVDARAPYRGVADRNRHPVGWSSQTHEAPALERRGFETKEATM